jgi:DNA-3-methyladenine glycosylase II
MTHSRATVAAAVRTLSRRDPVLRRIIRQIGPCPLKPGRQYFWVLAEAIVSQQLSVKAAATIFERLRRLYPDYRLPRPQDLLATPAHRLRAVGLSRQKIDYLWELSRAFQRGDVPLRRFSRMADEEIIGALTAIRGIGRWTAEMFLIFVLVRSDVLPVDDLGLQKAMQQAYELRDRPTPAVMRRIAKKWEPYRTIASWYLWSSRDGRPVVYGE